MKKFLLLLLLAVISASIGSFMFIIIMTIKYGMLISILSQSALLICNVIGFTGIGYLIGKQGRVK